MTHDEWEGLGADFFITWSGQHNLFRLLFEDPSINKTHFWKKLPRMSSMHDKPSCSPKLTGAYNNWMSVECLCE